MARQRASKKETEKAAARAVKKRTAGAERIPEQSDQQLRLLLLVTLERKYRCLMRCAQALHKQLKDPTTPRKDIEKHLTEIGVERRLLLTRIDLIEGGSSYHFPSDSDIADFRRAVSDLQTNIAQTAPINALIQTSNTVISSVKAENV